MARLISLARSSKQFCAIKACFQIWMQAESFNISVRELTLRSLSNASWTQNATT